MGGGGGARGGGAGGGGGDGNTPEEGQSPTGNEDYYAVLGVTTDATDAQLKRAYRMMSLKYHPDRAGGSTTAFQLVSTAYETLSHADKRAAYDEGADMKKKKKRDDDDSEESDDEDGAKPLREEVERKYFPERYKFWPFGDPFIEKRKQEAKKRKKQGRPAWGGFGDY